MQKKIIITFSSILLCSILSAQLVKEPSCLFNENPSLSINFIKKSKKNVTINFTHSASVTFDNGGWIYIGGEIKLIDKENNLTYKLMSFNGIDTLLSKRYIYNSINDSITFNLVFEPLNIKTKKIDIIECNSMNCFNFIDVNVSDKKNIYVFNADSVSESIPNLTSSKTITTEGRNVFNFLNNRYYGFKMFKADGTIETFTPTSRISYGKSSKGESLLEYNIIGDKGTSCIFQFIACRKIIFFFSNKIIEFNK